MLDGMVSDSSTTSSCFGTRGRKALVASVLAFAREEFQACKIGDMMK